jgi:lipopolysaccharide export system permease protein
MLKFLLYLSRSFLRTWIMVVFGFLILIGLLDSLANGADIVESGEGFSGTFKYMGLRAPVIFDRIFVFTLVVAILLTYVKLIRQHELVALLGFGISATRQVLLLVPVVLATSLASITFIDYAMAPAVRALQAWGIGEYKVKNITAENPLWLEDNGDIIRATDRESFETLAKVQIFKRDALGAVEEIIWADRAIYMEGETGWALQGIKTLRVADAQGEAREATAYDGTMRWETDQTPTSIARLAAEPRDLSLSEMRRFMQPGNSGSQPSFAYSFWHAHRLTRPIAALILLTACAALMQRTGREDTGDRTLIVGLAFGFLFLIIDGALATFASSGSLSVAPAIILPLFAFALFAGFMLTRTEAL